MKTLFMILTLVGMGFLFTPTAIAANSQDENLLEDGGFENIREAEVGAGGHFFNAIKAGCDMGGDLIVRVPKNLDQLSGAKKFIIVDGKPDKEVHSGEHALLFNGGFYLTFSAAAKEGDLLEASFYAKGKSKVSLFLPGMSAEGKWVGNGGLPQVYPVDLNSPDGWQQLTFRFTIKGEEVVKCGARFNAEGDVCIDDLVIRKLSGD